ncbi:MAG: TIGR02186 family protein [Alphaproteobacteria bacterium]
MTRRRHGAGFIRAAVLAALFLLAWRVAAPALAAPLVADLSKHLVAITTGFSGTEVLLFGAIEDEGDVVVIVRGPPEKIVMHRKSRIAGIWINTSSITFESVPSFYAVASSRPLQDIASEQVLARNEMGVEHLNLPLPRAKASPNIAEAWRQALIRNKQRLGHYASEPGQVTFLGNQLFRSLVEFPANVPTGTYKVEVYLLRDGRMISAQTTPLIVGKIGLQAEIFDFAYNHSALYGMIAILVALMAGWLAHVAFRKA